MRQDLTGHFISDEATRPARIVDVDHVVVVMKPAEHGQRRDRPDGGGSDALTGDRDPLADPLVGPGGVEVAQGVIGEDALQVRLGEE